MHAARHVFALLPLVLSATALGACDKLTATATARALQDGVRIAQHWSRTWNSCADYRCIASATGRCNIVVVVSVCAGASCDTRLVEELSLPAGASKTLTALPRGFKHCLTHDAKPAAPTCLKA